MALYDLLQENPDGAIPLPSPGPRTALVPGCGRGYDVLLLSSLGYDVYGLDVSSQALDAARRNAEKELAEGRYGTEGGERGAITWICQDFFAEDWKGVQTPFDLIFDYTVRKRRLCVFACVCVCVSRSSRQVTVSIVLLCPAAFSASDLGIENEVSS